LIARIALEFYFDQPVIIDRAEQGTSGGLDFRLLDRLDVRTRAAEFNYLLSRAA